MKNDKEGTSPQETTISIKFANSEAAHHFALWLCEHAEQDYWQWMERCEQEEEGNITATRFHYHYPQDETKAENDPARYKDSKFLGDNTIRTTCGRLDRRE